MSAEAYSYGINPNNIPIDQLYAMLANQSGSIANPGNAPNPNTPLGDVLSPTVSTPAPATQGGSFDFARFLNGLANQINSSNTNSNSTTPDARTAALGQVESTFGPNYGQKNIASSLLDDTINQVLSEQQNNASSYLDRGRKRGIYNDTGYNAGLSTLNSAAQAGRAKLNSLGSSVIDKYRSDLNSVRDQAYGAATAATDTTPFSLDPYISQGNEIIDRATNNAGGDLLNTLGGTQLFDFSSLNNKAGQAQGAINARDLDVLGAINQRKKAISFGRGLGTQGAF